MATTPQRGATLSEFRANGFDLARERREYEKGSDHERQELRRDEQRAQQILGGGTEDVSAGRRVAFAARAARERYEKNEEKRRKEDLEVMILTMMLDGDFSAYLSDQVVDNMSDVEISAFVDRIEQVTGKSLEDYAAELLGEENAQRKPDESEADYKRRIVKAIHKEVMDVSVDPDGNPVPKIKPKYADDAHIRDIFNQGVIQDYRDTVEQIKDDPDAPEKIREFSTRNYEAGDIARDSVEADVLGGMARNSQGMQRDEGLVAVERVENSAGVIGDLLGDSGPRAEASEALKAAFKESSEGTRHEARELGESLSRDLAIPRPS